MVQIDYRKSVESLPEVILTNLIHYCKVVIIEIHIRNLTPSLPADRISALKIFLVYL